MPLLKQESIYNKAEQLKQQYDVATNKKARNKILLQYFEVEDEYNEIKNMFSPKLAKIDY